MPLPHALPETIKASLKAYTGLSYKSINKALRGFGLAGAATQQHIIRIQKAFATTPPIQKTIQVKRGINRIALDNMAKQAGLAGADALLPGHIIQDKGFVSTSSGEGFSARVKLHITVPAGGKAIDVKPISKYSHENEILLPNGTKFKINEIKETSSGKHIHVEVLI